jgi:type II secretory pathway component GspD/PulD (secretin)
MIMVRKILSLLLLLFVAALFMFPVMAETTDPFILPQYSKKVSLDFKEADLKDVLKAFATQINSNFILMSDVVSKPVTVFLEEVPVESAFDMLLSANNLTYDYSDANNVFVIKKSVPMVDPVITKIFQLRYASVSSAKINSTLSGAAAGGAAAGGAAAGGGATGASAGISETIKSVLSKEGKMAEDARTNSLIITDLQSSFDSIEKTIARLDVPVALVQIEVEMLDVSKTSTDKLGAMFDGNNFPVTAGKFNATNLSWFNYETGAVTLSATRFTLDFYKQQKDTKSLARPKILTLDNETAEIMISTNEAVGATSATDETSGQTTYTAERTETGVFLTVTPQINLLTG